MKETDYDKDGKKRLWYARKCKCCGHTFWVSRRYVGRLVFCSLQCLQEWHSKHNTQGWADTCNTCCVEFLPGDSAEIYGFCSERHKKYYGFNASYHIRKEQPERLYNESMSLDACPFPFSFSEYKRKFKASRVLES